MLHFLCRPPLYHLLICVELNSLPVFPYRLQRDRSKIKESMTISHLLCPVLLPPTPAMSEYHHHHHQPTRQLMSKFPSAEEVQNVSQTIGWWVSHR